MELASSETVSASIIRAWCTFGASLLLQWGGCMSV